MVTRKRTLVRQDRRVKQRLITNQPRRSWFGWIARLLTCCIFPPCLSICGIKHRGPQQAWREKMTLCYIIIVLSAIVTFFMLVLNDLTCVSDDRNAYVPVDIPGNSRSIYSRVLISRWNHCSRYSLQFQDCKCTLQYSV